MNHTVTPFGKRLLREWISKPLFSIEDMNEYLFFSMRLWTRRYDAIDYMIQNPSFSSTLISLLKQLQDLERSVSRIEDYGSVFFNRMSAEGRAVFFDQLKYIFFILSSLSIVDIIKGRFMTFWSYLRDIIRFNPHLNQFDKNNFHLRICFLSSFYSL